jgi:hypothetical protein
VTVSAAEEETNAEGAVAAEALTEAEIETMRETARGKTDTTEAAR